MSLADHVKERAVALGFDLVGIAPAEPAPTADAYQRWLASGHHGEMAWMGNVNRRGNPRAIVEQARSVVVVGVSCFVADPPRALWNDPSRGRIARYAWGADYHDIMTPRLQQLAEFIRGQGDPGTVARHYCDTGPVLERAFAARAGLGFIGRNTMLISPEFGSHVLLGEILTTLELEPDLRHPGDPATLPFRDRHHHPKLASCGECRRCLDICPTHAFPASHVLNSRRCISYLTIELKGSIPLELRPLMGHWIFGCDDCQAVCPWVQQHARPAARPFLQYDPDRIAPPLMELMTLDEQRFRSRFQKTPVLRARRRGFLRNVAVALGNWGNRDALPVLERALQDPEPLVREHAAWAIERIERGPGG